MKNQGTHIFIFTIVLFAAGTSAISYSLAKEAVRKPVKRAAPKSETVAMPWYCIQASKNPAPAKELPPPGRAGYLAPAAGYYESTPGYATPGYNEPAPEYITPGYNTPGYAVPGYTTPAYQTPGYQPAGYLGDSPNSPTDPAITQNEAFAKLAENCPPGFTPNWRELNKTCDVLLRARLEKSPLSPVEIAKLTSCERKFKPEVWNSSVNKKVCTAIRSHKTSCVAAQKNGFPCRSLDGFMVPAGVQLNQINQVARDAALYCAVLFP